MPALPKNLTITIKTKISRVERERWAKRAKIAAKLSKGWKMVADATRDLSRAE